MCDQMKPGATNAKCGRCCAGACSTDGSGCTNGSRESSEPEALELQMLSEPMPLGSGPRAIAESLETGVDERREMVDRRLVRLVILILALLWGIGLASLVARCSA